MGSYEWTALSFVWVESHQAPINGLLCNRICLYPLE